MSELSLFCREICINALQGGARWCKVRTESGKETVFKMEEKIFLWPGAAPYAEQSPGQAAPSLTAFPAENARGAVVVIPGGGYVMKADHEGAPIARMLNGAGIAAYVLDYRVHPCHREAPLADAKRAVRLVRSMGYGKVGVLGFSAGGHLCCAAATLYDEGNPNASDPIERLSSRPDVFIPCYAVASFGPYTHEGSRDALLGEGKDDPALIRRFSAEENVTEYTPPAFLWHTAEDGLVPCQNSLNLAKALAEHHVPFELHIYEKGHHGLGLAAENGAAAAWSGVLCRWLLERGFGK